MSNRKVIICIILLVIAIILCVANYYVFKNNSSPKKAEDVVVSDDGIIDPDRIVIKVDGLFYEIYSDNEKYSQLVELVRETYKLNIEENISENEINNIKTNANFIEFDYDKASKNNVFVFSGEGQATWIHMLEDDGIVYQKENIEKNSKYKEIELVVRDITSNLENSLYDESLYRANNYYTFLPSTIDFEEVKQDDVYVRVIKDYDDFKKITDMYKFSFDTNLDYKNILEKHQFILILSRFDISDYKVNIGNVKLYFKGKSNTVPNGYEFIPMILSVGNVTNTNCIYYNYDNVEIVNNRFGRTEAFNGTVKYKNKINNTIYYTLTYTPNDDINLGTVKVMENTKINPDTEIEIGDWISGTGKYVNLIDDNGEEIKYEASSISVEKAKEREKLIKNYLEYSLENGIIEGTSIIDYHEDNSNSGYVIIGVLLGENSSEPDIYLKVNYDQNTESYLGMGRHLQGNYGIVKNEMVDITLETPVDINNMKAKMFEYIAD